MRHRFTVALYDEYPLEGEILDYLVPYGRGKRQEVLRMLVKAGYAAMVQHKSASSAMMNAVDPDSLALLVQALAGSQALGGGASSSQEAQSSMPANHGYTNNKTVEEQKKTSSDSYRGKQEALEVNFDESEALSEFEPEDVEEDDLEDPMKKFMQE